MNHFIKASTHWLSFRLILGVLISVFAATAFAADCKINDSDTSAEYVGDCDNGLVQAKRKKKSKRYVPEVAQPTNPSVASNNQRAVVAPIADTPTMPQQTISTISQPQSLINNKSIKNFQAKFSTDIATNVGSGSCETSIANIKVAGNEILVTVKKPKKCAFETLELIYGSDVLPLSGLGEEFETKNALYKWRDDVQQGSLLFSKNSNQLVINPAELKIREPRCGDVNCLTSTGLPPQKEITESQQPVSGSRLAAGGDAAVSIGFKDNNDGTVTDPRTGLMWARCTVGKTWNGKTCDGKIAYAEHHMHPNYYNGGTVPKARYVGEGGDSVKNAVGIVKALQNFDFAGHRDWRIPTIQELQNLLPCSDGNQVPELAGETIFFKCSDGKVPRLDPNIFDGANSNSKTAWEHYQPLSGTASASKLCNGDCYGSLNWMVAYITSNGAVDWQGTKMMAVRSSKPLPEWESIVKASLPIKRAMEAEAAEINRKELESKRKVAAEEKLRQAREREEYRRREAYANTPAGRADAQRQQGRQMCEAQKQTCFASCPPWRDAVGVNYAAYSCEKDCQKISCN